MTNQIFKAYETVRLKSSPEERIYQVMVSTEEKDRDGEIIRATGIKFQRYLSNPVVAFGHQYNMPSVAKTRSLEIMPGRGLKSTFQFPKPGISARADEIHGLWAAGFLNAASIGFMPLPGGKKPLSEDSPFGPWEYTSIELLEWSIVLVGANAGALALAMKTLKTGIPQSQELVKMQNELGNQRFWDLLSEYLDVLTSYYQSPKPKLENNPVGMNGRIRFDPWGYD